MVGSRRLDDNQMFLTVKLCSNIRSLGDSEIAISKLAPN